MRFDDIDLRFFDEEPAPETPEVQKETPDELLDRQLEEAHSASFDEKSPLMSGGISEEQESEAPDPDSTPAPVTPFRVLKVGGRDVNVSSQEEYDRMATAGVEAQASQQRINPYLPYIGALESDPELATAVNDLILARQRGGVPAQQPVAETTKPEEPPEQGEDELFDDYEKRLEDWEADKQKRFVADQVTQTLEAREAQARQVKTQELQGKVVDFARGDPHLSSVLGMVQSEQFPASIREAMDSDPKTFMVVYDSICAIQGRPGYFGAPLNRTQSPQSPQSGETPKDGRAVLKEKRPVPFAERGGATPVNSGRGKLPNFKTMSEAEFERTLSASRNKGF